MFHLSAMAFPSPVPPPEMNTTLSLNDPSGSIGDLAGGKKACCGSCGGLRSPRHEEEVLSRRIPAQRARLVLKVAGNILAECLRRNLDEDKMVFLCVCVWLLFCAALGVKVA